MIADLAARWLSRAEELERFGSPAAVAFRDCARELESELRAGDDELLTLAQASTESGLHADTIRHKIAAGEIPNAGRKGSPRVRRGDLPRRKAAASPGRPLGASHQEAPSARRYDVDADARRLVSI
jgi:hypothetical protein